MKLYYTLIFTAVSMAFVTGYFALFLQRPYESRPRDIVEIEKPFIIYPTQQPRPGEAIKFGMCTLIPYAEADSVKTEQSKTL